MVSAPATTTPASAGFNLSIQLRKTRTQQMNNFTSIVIYFKNSALPVTIVFVGKYIYYMKKLEFVMNTTVVQAQTDKRK